MNNEVIRTYFKSSLHLFFQAEYHKFLIKVDFLILMFALFPELATIESLVLGLTAIFIR